MGIKEVIKKIFHTGEDKTEYTTEMNNLENVRIYIKQQLREKGLKNNQIEMVKS